MPMRIYLLLPLLIPAICNAADLEYKCTVKGEISLQDDGNLKPHARPIEIGKQFVVDRVSGKVVSAPLRNLTAAEIRVLNRGSKDHTFELLSVSSPTGKATTDLLVIHEFVKNKNKPFVAVTSVGEVYSGICE
jgi:hypothetical protein